MEVFPMPAEHSDKTQSTAASVGQEECPGDLSNALCRSGGSMTDGRHDVFSSGT
jgi:hypothetical protein